MRNYHVSWLITSPSGKTRSNQDTHLSQKKLLSASWAAQRQRHQLSSVPSQSWHSQQTQWSWLPVRVPRVAQQGVLAAQPLEGRMLSGIKKCHSLFPKCMSLMKKSVSLLTKTGHSIAELEGGLDFQKKGVKLGSGAPFWVNSLVRNASLAIL